MNTDTIVRIGEKAFTQCPNINVYDIPDRMLDDYCDYFDY